MDLKSLAESASAALIVVDQQYDFEPGGALAVSGGDEILGPISKLMQQFQNVILTQDFHPQGHISFASSYEGKKPFDLLTLEEVKSSKLKSAFSNEVLVSYLSKTREKQQILWPDHCVQGTRGCEIDSRLPLDRAQLILRKGYRLTSDSLSAFFENDGQPTGLGAYLKERGIQKLVICGLAGDVCVALSVRDAKELGFDVVAPAELTRNVRP